MRVLFVDDDRNVLEVFQSVLQSREASWHMSFFTSSIDALAYLSEHDVDTIVTDIQMPGMDGFEFIRQIREGLGRRDVPIIAVTGLGESSLKRRLLDLGATDLLEKPVSNEDLIARLKSTLLIKSQQDELKAYSESLEKIVAQRTQALEDSRLDILWRLGKAAECRDEETGHHIIRVSLYSRLLAEGLGLDGASTERIFLTSPLHDVGKIAIPDAILLKPGKLSDDQWTIIKTHCEEGARILCGDSLAMKVYYQLQGRLVSARSEVGPLLKTAAVIALSHHEKWDGSGYPKGLSGDTIPLEGRIVALADVYDALSSKRPYKSPLAEANILGILNGGIGTHFDPDVHAAFERLKKNFFEIRQTYADEA